MAVKFVFVTCGECGAEVDRIEYDSGVPSPAVQNVSDGLGLSLAEAHALVAQKNPGAELSSEDRAHALAEQIADKAVTDRAKATYVCPVGHKKGLTVSATTPTRAITTKVERE